MAHSGEGKDGINTVGFANGGTFLGKVGCQAVETASWEVLSASVSVKWEAISIRSIMGGSSGRRHGRGSEEEGWRLVKSKAMESDDDSVDINWERRVGHRNSRFTSMRITIALVLQLWASLEILQDQSIRPSTHCAGDCTAGQSGGI